MDLDPVLLSRLQFAFTVAFHILFPALTIGLASFLVILEAQWLRHRDPLYRGLYEFWVKIFALSFGMGVVTGIPMSFQFGTNWSQFSELTGNVVGPLIGYEVLTAFFLEASFLGIMLFGWRRVGPRLHFFSTVMVALGTVISAFWILSANSWMHTPAGYSIDADGVFQIESWVQAIFNPSFPYRFVHMVLAAFLTTSFVVAGISAWLVLKDKNNQPARKSLILGIALATVLAPAQIVAGDLHGLNTFEHQPMKVAAMEAAWETQAGAPLHLFAVPDQDAATNHFEISIPAGASFILTHHTDGVVQGLTEVPAADRPPVAIVFYAFRIMVALGIAMLAVAWLGAWLVWRGRIFDTRWFLWLSVAASPLGFVAVLAGWIVTEVGRQPWIVQGLMRVADSASPVVGATQVMASLLLFVVVYNLLLVTYLYFLYRLVNRPKGMEAEPPPQTRPGLAAWHPAMEED